MKCPSGVLLLAVGFLVCFSGIWVVPLHEPDEGRYAEIALHMAQTSDWLTPRLNGIRYFEKPPLFFWLTALSIRILGPSEFAVRLCSVLAACVVLAFTLSLAARLFGPQTARLSALLLLTAPLFALFAKMALVDMVLTACITGAFWSVSQAAVSNRTPSPREALIFWLMAAAAVLCKGPIGVVLPLLGFALFSLRTKSGRFFGGLAMNPLGLAAFASAAVPWFLLMELRHPGYLQTFLVEQNLGRIASTHHFQRFRPFWYYVPMLGAFLAPWTLFLPDVVVRFVKSARRGNRTLRRSDVINGRLLLNCLWAGPFVLFAFTQSKHGYYLLPVFPPLCILIADVFLTRDDASPRAHPAFRRRFVVLTTTCFVTAGILLAGLVQHERVEELLLDLLATPQNRELLVERIALLFPMIPYLTGALTLVGVASVLSTRWGRTGRGCCAEPTIAALAVVICALPWMARPLGPLYSGRPIAVAIQADPDTAGATVIFFQRYYRTVSFYLGRPGILWRARFDEFGLYPTPQDLAGFSVEGQEGEVSRLWAGEDTMVAVVFGSDRMQDFRKMTPGQSAHVIAKIGEAFVVKNRNSIPRDCREPPT